MQIVKTRFIIQHITGGYFINSFYEKVPMDRAMRFSSVEDARYFYEEGNFKSDNPGDYTVRAIQISYQLLGDEANEREHEHEYLREST